MSIIETSYTVCTVICAIYIYISYYQSSQSSLATRPSVSRPFIFLYLLDVVDFLGENRIDGDDDRKRNQRRPRGETQRAVALLHIQYITASL
jgi:hypothetical protein